MSTSKIPLKYVDNPQKYCSYLTELIEKANNEWQTVWKSAILELFGGPEYSINSVNALLKVIEKAFKERKYHVRAQAFDCWQFFIQEVEKKTACEKLLNVILIPLSAGNHSVKIVLDAKLKAWLILLQTNTLCKSIAREKGIPSLLKILYGPHALETASSYNDLLELGGMIYSLMVQKCLKTDENNVILSYLPKAVPILSVDDNKRCLGKNIWIDAIEYVSTKKWPIAQFSHLLKTLENVLSANRDQDKTFMRELLPILICEYNSYPVDHLMSHLSLLTRCLFYSASDLPNLSSTLEYLTKKFRKKEHILFDELKKTLTEFSDDYKEQLERCWAAVVLCFCKWNKGEIEGDNHIWLLLFPVEYLHEKWNSNVQNHMQTCFENMYSVSKVDVFIRNVTRKLNTFLNNSENVPLSLLSAATCLCKIVLQKSRPNDDVSATKDNLMTIYEKFPPQTTVVEGPQTLLICKYLSCVLYFTQRYPEYDHEFRPIICKYSECIDVDKDMKDYPVAQLLSKYTNKTKEDEKLSNVLNIIRVTPNKTVNQGFLARLSPAENKVLSGSPFGIRSAGTNKLQNGGTPNVKSADDGVQFVTITTAPKNSPMTEHQREMAKQKSYIPAMYEDLSQSQSYSDSQPMLPTEKTLPAVKIPPIEIIEENANLPSCDTNGDSADEIPASLDFREAIRKDKLPISFASKKSLFNEVVSSSDHSENSTTTTQPTKRKSVRIESKVADTPTTTKRARLSCPNRIQTAGEQESTPLLASQCRKSTTKATNQRRSAVPSEIEDIKIVECDSQSLFVSQMQSTTPTTPFSSSSACPENKNGRRKSLKSKSSNLVPARSPINTRKRKSIVGTMTSDSASKNASAFEIEDSCSETDERSVKREKCENEKPTTTTTTTTTKVNDHHPVESSIESGSSNSSTVTVIAANDKAFDPTDSVMIVEEDVEQQIIVIDSENLLAPAEKEVIVCPTETKETTEVAEQETVVNEAKAMEEEDTLVVQNTPVESELVEGDRCPEDPFEERDRMVTEKVESMLRELAESPEANDHSDHQGTPEQTNVDVPQSKEALQQQQQPSNESPENVENECVANKKVKQEENAPVEKEAVGGRETTGSSGAIETNTVSTSDDVSISASSLSSNSRSLQMLKMVFNGSPDLQAAAAAASKTRFRTKARRPSTNASPAANGRIHVNGMSARMAANCRPMKMLQVNGLGHGHIENFVVKQSPKKIVNLAEKMEKFRYVPKECTSPSILKKPNLNDTLSPKSPKSVNFADRLTDTREYNVNEELIMDSWNSSGGESGSQGDNLISDDEATSQETLYPCLHNCTDDIKNIAERLTMNQQQLDTLKRMGIETVGQLASASTIVGKSIPVGDNRIQRLRNALQAYDDDRKLKGLRALSVRRKITYRSPVEVTSIIEVLDDETKNKTNVEPRSSVIKVRESVNTDKASGTNGWTPTVTLQKLSSEKVAAYKHGGSPPNDAVAASSPTGETQRCSSPLGLTQQCSSAATKTIRSQTSPVDNFPFPPPNLALLTENAARMRKASSSTTSPCKSTDSSPPKSTEQSSDPAAKTNTSAQNSPQKSSEAPASASPQKTETVLEVVRVDPPNREKENVDVENMMEIEEVEVEKTLKEGEKDSGSAKQPTNGGCDFWECTQDDEPDFICTNQEESSFTNGDRRTYSKSARTTESGAVARPKCSIPDSVEKEDTSPDNESKEDRAEETSATEEQNSVSIFSSEATKLAEDANDVSEVALEGTESVEKVADASVANAATVEDAAVALSSSSCRIQLVCEEEDDDLMQGNKIAEKVLNGELRRILEPYVGPSCLSKWSDEATSGDELRGLFRSMVEAAIRIRGADLMDDEMKNVLRQIKDLVDDE